MGVVITIDDIRAYTEVDYIINHMNQKYIDKVPEKLLDFFSDFSDPNYDVKINAHLPLENQGLHRYALEIIAIMHLKYWCEDEKRKQELYNIMLNNNKEKLAEHLRYRDSIESLFSNDKNNDEEETEEIDYSKPKQIQKYDTFVTRNEDIKDYTDVVEDNNETLPVENDVKEHNSFFEKIKNVILSIFRK